MIDRVHNPPYPPPNGLPKIWQAPISRVTETPKTLVEEALEQVESYTRRIIDLETRIAALEAALDKQTGEK